MIIKITPVDAKGQNSQIILNAINNFSSFFKFFLKQLLININKNSKNNDNPIKPVSAKISEYKL